MSGLNLFPARIEIGQFKGADGKDIKVYQSPEFARALSDLLVRAGGANGLSTEELAILVTQAQLTTGAPAQPAETSFIEPAADVLPPALAQLAQQVADLQQQVEMLAARPGPAENYSAQEMAIAYSFSGQGTDWEHPGKIGESTRNSGKFTTLAANAKVELVPANANVVISPTGTGVVTIAPAALGTMDNVEIGATTAKPVKGTTVTATGGLGCNGKAAQTSFALGAAATDLATVLVLANNLRTMSINNGTGA